MRYSALLALSVLFLGLLFVGCAGVEATQNETPHPVPSANDVDETVQNEIPHPVPSANDVDEKTVLVVEIEGVQWYLVDNMRHMQRVDESIAINIVGGEASLPQLTLSTSLAMISHLLSLNTRWRENELSQFEIALLDVARARLLWSFDQVIAVITDDCNDSNDGGDREYELRNAHRWLEEAGENVLAERLTELMR